MNIFLIGMSGIGMQALAMIAKKAGYNVSGYDDACEIEALKNNGINYTNNIDKTINLIVYSSAITPDHFLMMKARKLGIMCLNRTDFLIKQKLNENKILIAGAHGKTTTTSMLAYILGMKSYLIGGILKGYEFAGDNQKDAYTVIEADESDGSFIKWETKYKIITNFDFEHMDFFKTEQNIIEHYKKFILQNIENETIIININAKNSLNIPNHKNIITFGSQEDSANETKPDYIYHDIKFEEDGLNFKINNNDVVIPLLGEHNAANFTAIYILCNILNIAWQNIATFPGIKKRVQLLEKTKEYEFYLDYGHHPKEVSATLNAFLQHKKIKPSVIIELHRYSRAKYTWYEWPKVLKGYNVLITPIHTANEEPIKGVNEESFIEFLNQNEVKAEFLQDIKKYKPTNNTICFSAGKISKELEKIYD